VVIRGLTLRAVAISAVLGATFIASFVALSIALRAMQRAEDSSARTELVLETSHVLENSVLDLETGVRGYLLSDQRRFLRPYRTALVNYPRQERKLAQLTSGDPVQQQRVRALSAAIGAYVHRWAAPTVARGALSPFAVRRSV